MNPSRSSFFSKVGKEVPRLGSSQRYYKGGEYISAIKSMSILGNGRGRGEGEQARRSVWEETESETQWQNWVKKKKKYKKRNRQVKRSVEKHIIHKQINRQAEKKQDDRSFQLAATGREQSSQWNSSYINSESSTAESHYVGETQVSANLTSDCLSMPARTPLITPCGLCHLLKSWSLTWVCNIWFVLSVMRVWYVRTPPCKFERQWWEHCLLVVHGCRCLTCVWKCKRQSPLVWEMSARGALKLPHHSFPNLEAIKWNVVTLFVWTVGVESRMGFFFFCEKYFDEMERKRTRCNIFSLCQQTSL